MSCPDPYRPYNPFEDAPTPDAALKLQSDLPSDAEIRNLTSALAANGGGSASEDLALDLVLNQIVEQACLATGATGAAIALTRDGEMVCRATTGRTAPDLGVRLDNAGFSAECLRVGTLQRCDDTETDPRVDASACRLLGVRSILVVPLWYWGEFMGIFEIFSPRSNAFGERDEQTLQALAYRIVRHTKQAGGQIAGFSSQPEEGADTPASISKPEPARAEIEAVEPNLQPAPEVVRERLRTPVFELKPKPARKISDSADRWTTPLAISAGVIACLIVGLMAWRLAGTRSSAQKAAPAVESAPQAQELDLAPVTASAAPATPEEPKPAMPAPQSRQSAPGAQSNSAAASDVVISAASKSASKATSNKIPSSADEAQSGVPTTGGLAIYDEKGKLIYGKPIHPEQSAPAAKAPSKPRAAANPASPRSELPSAAARISPSGNAASSVKSAALLSKSLEPAPDDRFVRLKPELAESLLDQRVEPEYPEAARRGHIQGSVVLETLIGANGRVQQVSAVSGNPDLADAAIAAVRQWRYKPFTVDGKKVPIRTQVNVTFLQAQ
jgi:TonB family protein